jgi:hypothetical protein
VCVCVFLERGRLVTTFMCVYERYVNLFKRIGKNEINVAISKSSFISRFENRLNLIEWFISTAEFRIESIHLVPEKCCDCVLQKSSSSLLKPQLDNILNIDWMLYILGWEDGDNVYIKFKTTSTFPTSTHGFLCTLRKRFDAEFTIDCKLCWLDSGVIHEQLAKNVRRKCNAATKKNR